MKSVNFGRGLVAFVVVGASLAGGCAGGGGGSMFGGGGGAMTSLGIPGDRTLTATNGQQYQASELEPLGGQLTMPNGEVALSFVKRKSTWDKIGSGILGTATSAVGGLGGAYAGRAISGGAIGTSVGAVTGAAGSNAVLNGVTGAGDPNIIWVTRSQLQPQQTASLGSVATK